MKTILKIAAACTVLLIAVVLYFSRVPIPEEKDCLTATGVVTSITEGGVKDIVFSLNNTKTLFYINRGLQNGFTLPDLRKELVGKEITIKYPDYWSIIPSDEEIKNISKLYYNNKAIFSEID